MKQTNEFDDLARRKLEERAFPMEAAHWEDMQRLLALEQRKRRGFYSWAPDCGGSSRRNPLPM
jgi:hypothetical protein